VTGEKLIVFVKAPRPGSVKTRLAQAIGAQSACAAYSRMVAALLNQLRSLDAVELCFTPQDAADEIRHWLREGWTIRPQVNGDLGRRLGSAFEHSFNSGARQVVVIGSDCPAVTAEDVRKAWEGLQTHDVVLGPATDGGYWLIGLRQTQPALFQAIPWSSGQVFPETIKRIRQCGLRVQILRELRDLDTEADWRTFLSCGKAGKSD